MKRFASLFIALMLLLPCLTAFAADNPAENVIEGIGSAQDDPAGILEGIDAAQKEAEVETPSNSKTPGVLNRQQDFSENGEKRTEPPTELLTELPTEASTAATQPATAAPTQPQTDENAVNYTAMIIVIACSAALLIILLVVSAVLLRKKKASDSEESPRSTAFHGIVVRVEVLSGVCYNASLTFHLRRNLTIGSGAGCDLVFEDPQMLDTHAVIARNNGIVTIGECTASGVTYIGGMKIFAPNRLRSGDVVTIGSTSFRVIFES